jgi:phage terminase large subunit GpA-like protein
VLALAAPPERIALSEWAHQYACAVERGIRRAGPWRTLAFQREPLDAIAPGSPYESVVLVWASQLGKSELWLTLLSYIPRALSFTVRRESQ